MVILDMTTMQNIQLIENLLLKESLPACIPRMHSKNNDTVVTTFIQNLVAKSLVKFLAIGSVNSARLL